MRKPEWSWNFVLISTVVYSLVVELLDRRPEVNHVHGFLASALGWTLGCVLMHFILFFIWKAKQR